jgi:hypothetical protein
VKFVWNAEDAQAAVEKHNSDPKHKPVTAVRIAARRWVVIDAQRAKYFHEWKEK